MSLLDRFLPPHRREQQPAVKENFHTHRRQPTRAGDIASAAAFEAPRRDASRLLRESVDLSAMAAAAILPAVPNRGDTLIPYNSSSDHPFTVRIFTQNLRHARLVYGIHNHPTHGVCVLTVPSHGPAWMTAREDHRARHTGSDGRFKFDPTFAESLPWRDIHPLLMPAVVEWASNSVRFGRGLHSNHSFIGEEKNAD